MAIYNGKHVLLFALGAMSGGGDTPVVPDEPDVPDVPDVPETNPTTIKPTVSISLTNYGTYEVGASITPAYQVTFNEGSYSDNNGASGVTINSRTVKDSKGKTKTDASGKFDTFVVGDDTNYNVTVTIAHSAGRVPLTSKGNPYAAGQIQAGTITATSTRSITGYRKCFYGTLTDTGALDSSKIRSLGTNSSISISPGTKQIVVAFPADSYTLDKIAYVEFGNNDVKSFFKAETVNVAGANGYSPMPYTVYVFKPAMVTSSYTYNVTLKEKE